MIWVDGMVCMVWEDIKVALCVCPNHTDYDIHSDHSYLDTLGIPLDFTLRDGLLVMS